jgi:hypothetical protein
LTFASYESKELDFLVLALCAEVPGRVVIPPIIAKPALFSSIYRLQREDTTGFNNTVATKLSGGIWRKSGVYRVPSYRNVLPVTTLCFRVMNNTFSGILRGRFF